MAKIDCWTDGSCIGNPGPGGWAAYFPGTKKMISGNTKDTTNNGMEMMAVLYALGECDPGDHLVIHTDSKMVIGWLCKQWKTEKSPHIGEIRAAISKFKYTRNIKLSFVKVEAHSNNRYNEMADAEAKMKARVLANSDIRIRS